MRARIRHLDCRDPDRVRQPGVDHGGPLKLVHRTDPDNAFPVLGEFIVVKWPAYTQWSGRGERSANATEYWLMEVTEEASDENHHLTTCRVVREIEPGRKRSLVSALKDAADRLAEAAADDESA